MNKNKELKRRWDWIIGEEDGKPFINDKQYDDFLENILVAIGKMDNESDRICMNKGCSNNHNGSCHAYGIGHICCECYDFMTTPTKSQEEE